MAIDIQQFNLTRIGATKTNVTLSPVQGIPPTDGIALAILSVDNARQNEISNCFTKLRDFIIESESYDFIGPTIYTFMPVDGGNSNIETTTSVGGMPDNSVIIAMDVTFLEAAKGSQIFDAMVEYCRNAAHDSYFNQV